MISWLLTSVLLLPQAQSKFENVSFKTQDGVTIAAFLSKVPDPASKPAVIFIHMYGSHKGEYREALVRFASSGITGLAIDLRGHGSSVKGEKGEDLSEAMRKKDPKLFNDMYKDVEAAVAYLTDTLKVDPNKIGIVGASVGGSVAIHAASKNPKIGAVAWLTPGENYLGVPTMEHIKSYGTRPILLITAEDEEAKGTTQMMEALKGNSKAEKMVLQITKAHGTNIFNKKEIYTGLVAWFTKQLSTAAATSIPSAPAAPAAGKKH